MSAYGSILLEQIRIDLDRSIVYPFRAFAAAFPRRYGNRLCLGPGCRGCGIRLKSSVAVFPKHEGRHSFCGRVILRCDIFGVCPVRHPPARSHPLLSPLCPERPVAAGRHRKGSAGNPGVPHSGRAENSGMYLCSASHPGWRAVGLQPLFCRQDDHYDLRHHPDFGWCQRILFRYDGQNTTLAGVISILVLRAVSEW